MSDRFGEQFTQINAAVDPNNAVVFPQPDLENPSSYRFPNIQHMLSVVDHQDERVITLDASSYSIGRHPANAIMIQDDVISRQHALLLRLPKSKSGDCLFRIIDGNLQGRRSQNGILVNGERCYAHDLRDQDVITFSENIHATYRQVHQPSPNNSLGVEPPQDVTAFNIVEQEKFSDTQVVRLSSFPEMMPHPIMEVDNNNQITYLNPAAEKQFPGIRGQINHPILRGLKDVDYSKTYQCNLREVTVGDRAFEQYIHCIPQSGLMRCYFIDVTQRVKMEDAVRKSEERYALAARGANDGLWDWDVVNDTMYFSPRWKSMIGYDEHELADHIDEWLNRVHPAERQRVKLELQRNLKGHKAFVESEFRMQHRDGDYRHFRSRGVVVFNEQKIPLRMAGSLTDITEFHLAREQLLRDAFYDALTSLPNRVLLMDRISQALKQCKRHNDRMCGVLFLDLDRFKVVNDSLGHMMGDRLLLEVSERLKTCVREEDTVARLGGDEFVILIHQMENVEGAIATAQRIQTALKHPIDLDGREIYSSASIGIATGSPHYEQPEELLRDADVAMYQAKHSGKERYVVFQNTMHSEAMELLNLENDLRRAIERQEFQLHYQPIIDLNTSQISAFEALLRWYHPERGLVSPVNFIPLAEDTGLIIPLGNWILRDACQSLHKWQRTFPMDVPLSVCVNIASCQFADPEFVNTVKEILDEIPLAKGSLKLEITESVIMQQPEMAGAKLEQLKELGVKLSVDDFGTGYSSLNYLQSFPVDTLKIDRSFVLKMGHPDSREIVKTIVMLAHNLKLDVVAEGVETEAQANLLKSMDCEYVQGFYYSRPVERCRANQLLEDQFSTPSDERSTLTMEEAKRQDIIH